MKIVKYDEIFAFILSILKPNEKYDVKMKEEYYEMFFFSKEIMTKYNSLNILKPLLNYFVTYEIINKKDLIDDIGLILTMNLIFYLYKQDVFSIYELSKLFASKEIVFKFFKIVD